MVVKPKDGDPRECYVMVTINEDSNMLYKDSNPVEFIRVRYDIERATSVVEEYILPNGYAKML